MNQLNNLYQDNPSEDEPKQIQQMLELSKYFHERQKKKLLQYRRGQHVKDTGCVKAEFTVHELSNELLRQGIFREPRTYSAILRFSNGSAESMSDQKQARGLAIKLSEVDGKKALPSEYLLPEDATTQDFLLVNHPVFVFPNVQEYIYFFKLRKQLGDKLARLVFAITRPRLARIAKATQEAKVTNPLSLQYWSMSPYRLGSEAMKFTVKPREYVSDADSTASQNQENYLFDALVNRIAQGDFYFDFLVQLKPNELDEWIEDASKEWTSEFVHVATIKIPQTDLNAKEMQDFRKTCEEMAFNPWHALEEHKPLGGINRLRREVYIASSKRRLTHDS